MRRGRALAPHPTLRRDDTGREVVSRRVISHLLEVSEVGVYRALRPVACDVATRALLYDAAEAEQRWLPRRAAS